VTKAATEPEPAATNASAGRDIRNLSYGFGRFEPARHGSPRRVSRLRANPPRACAGRSLRDTYPDGREFVGVSVIPDVKVEPTQADIAAGRYFDSRDPGLDKGVEVLKAAIAQNRK